MHDRLIRRLLMSVFDEVHDREVEQHRRNMFYALILVAAIVVTVASIFLAYV